MPLQKHWQWWVLFQLGAGQELRVSHILLATGYYEDLLWAKQVERKGGRK